MDIDGLPRGICAVSRQWVNVSKAHRARERENERVREREIERINALNVRKENVATLPDGDNFVPS